MTTTATTERVGGFDIPKLGLGMLGNHDEDAQRLAEAALAEGYRHIDTSEYYGNEVAVGRAIARSSVAREDIWLTTKVLHPKAPVPPDARSAAEASLARLDVDYVDLLLIHWPNPLFDLEETLAVFTALRDEGRARAIGVSNFPIELLREALGYADHIVTDQVEYHPYIDQSAILAEIRKAGLTLTAHSPLARGKVNDDPLLKEIGAGHGLSAAQVALRWLIQQDRVIAIPGGKPDEVGQLKENVAVLDAALTDDEMARISALAGDQVRIVDPPFAPAWDA